MDSEVEILRSDAVLIEVIGALDLVSDPEFSPDFRPFDRARAALGLGAPPHDGAALQHVLDELRKAVKIERRGLTYVIAVSARSESAQKAARIANTIAGVYIGNQLRDKSGHMRAASRTVEANLAHARAALIEAQARLDRFSRDNRPILVASSPIEQASADPAPDQLASLFELQQSAELAQSQYRTLLARSAQLRVQSELQLSDSRLVSAALPPSEPAFPQPGIMLVLAGFFGAGAGVVFAFLFENLVGGIASEAQLEAVTGRPCLGAVPLEPLVPGTASVAALLVEAPLSPFSEAVRRVRAGLDRHLSARACADHGTGRVILVSSSVNAEGKSGLALALARAYAAAGKRTLIIDCDLRRPSVHTQLGVGPSIGLSDYLAGRCGAGAPSAMIVHDADTGLAALVGAHPAETPTDQLIDSASFAQLMKAARENFEIVVLDSPPVLPIADGLYLARHTTAVVMAVKWAATAQSQLRMAMARLDRAMPEGPPVFTVLTQHADAESAYRLPYGTG